MLGGGQLGRMFTEAAQRLGYRVVVLEPSEPCPAGLLADEHLVAGYDHTEALDRLGEMCEAASYEFEAVPAQAVEYLRDRITVRPDAQPLSVAQSRLAEKRFAAEHTPATPPVPYQPIEEAAQLPAALEHVGFPCILKTDRLGYDGKGQAVVESPADAEAAFSRFGNVSCVLERRLDLQQEVSVIVARDCEHSVAYPVAGKRAPQRDPALLPRSGKYLWSRPGTGSGQCAQDCRRTGLSRGSGGRILHHVRRRLLQ